METYFDYCDKNDIEILIATLIRCWSKKIDLNKMNRFMSKEYHDLKIEGGYKSDVIISQDKFSLRCDDQNEIRNMTIVQNLDVRFPTSVHQ
jgi:hypothetical protein